MDLWVGMGSLVPAVGVSGLYCLENDFKANTVSGQVVGHPQ